MDNEKIFKMSWYEIVDIYEGKTTDEIIDFLSTDRVPHIEGHAMICVILRRILKEMGNHDNTSDA